MYDICTIGHITLDKVVTDQAVRYMPGGTSFYFSKALRQFDIAYALVTAVAETEQYIVTDIREQDQQKVFALPSRHTVYFENIYMSNQDHRDQNVHYTADPFTVELMPAIQAKIFHLGPLLADDFSNDLVLSLSKHGRLSLDIQGYLRYVHNKKVHYRDWVDKKSLLPHISILKANELEMEVITGQADVKQGARYLADWGVEEVIITLGSKGSLVYTGGDFHLIPAFEPVAVVDATGCGDTYMAGYLFQRVQGASIQQAGEFGAAMATLKLEHAGPYTAGPTGVSQVLSQETVRSKIYPE
ncbi:MAG: PfkB family carbohydrate kinase [Siphonobacter sp.]